MFRFTQEAGRYTSQACYSLMLLVNPFFCFAASGIQMAYSMLL